MTNTDLIDTKLSTYFKKYKTAPADSIVEIKALGQLLKHTDHLVNYLAGTINDVAKTEYVRELLLVYKTDNAREIAKLQLLAEKFYAFVSNLICEPNYKRKLYKALNDSPFIHQGAKYYIVKRMAACLNEESKNRSKEISKTNTGAEETISWKDLCSSDSKEQIETEYQWTDLIDPEIPPA